MLNLFLTVVAYFSESTEIKAAPLEKYLSNLKHCIDGKIKKKTRRAE
jgi:hypothetical protein